MKHIVLIILFYSSLTSWGQGSKKLLTKTQLDSVDHGQTINFKVDKLNCNYFEGFQGTTKAKKIKGKIYFDFIGESSRFDKDGRLNAKFTYDELGQIKTYQEFNSNGQIIYDCDYETKQNKGSTYRLEHLKNYYDYEPTILWFEGYRYLKQTDIGGHLKYSSNKKFGVWNYYEMNGRLQKTKDYGEIK
jgi:hypothetical protein